MTEFVGRTGALRVYSYPETSRAGKLSSLARNFATGPKINTGVASAGTQIPWNAIDAGAVTPTPNVPITCRSSGFVLLEGVVVVGNSDITDQTVSVQVQIDSVTQPIPLADQVTVQAGAFAAIPVLAELSQFVIGTTITVQLLVSTTAADGLVTLSQESSSLSLQEVPPATG
jgi:hypothetical protein